MARPVLPNKRFSLANLIDGWTDEHFISYRPFDYKDVQKLKGMDEKDPNSVDGMTDMLKSHFVAGAWLVADDDGTNERTEEMTAEDILSLPMDVTNAWLKTGMGNVDPKLKAN